jgi:hypothetical protein
MGMRPQCPHGLKAVPAKARKFIGNRYADWQGVANITPGFPLLLHSLPIL